MFTKLMGQVPTIVIAAATASIFGGGAAYAAAQITSAQIADQTIQSRDIGAEGVGTSEVRNQSIVSGDIAEGGVGTSEVRDGSITGADINDTTEKNLKGATGPQGEKGEKGDPGLSGVHADAPYGADLPGQDSSTTNVPAGSVKVVWTACAPGEVATGGGYRLNGHAAEAFQGGGAAVEGISAIASEAAYFKDGALVNGSEVAPVNENLSFAPNAWAVTMQNDSADEKLVRVWVVCAKVAD